MKIPEPKQKPNGKWIIQIQIDGKRKAKEFDAKQDALMWALSAKADSGKLKIDENRNQITLGQAISRYIESRSSVLSPSTILGYNKIRKNLLQDIMDIQLDNLSNELIQRSINRMAKGKSPKYVKNAYGLVSATLSKYYPELSLDVTLPQKQKPEIKIPTDEEISKIAADCKGKKFELPFLLGALMGLRTSEIRGLTWDCIEPDNVLHIKHAIVDGEDGAVLKTTKTVKSDRKLKMPDAVAELIKSAPHGDDEYIVHYNRNQLYKCLERSCERLHIQKYRFHDLRHYYASQMIALGMPDLYAMEQMGHSSTNMLKNVYGHTINSEKEKMVHDLNNQLSEKLKCNQMQPK